MYHDQYASQTQNPSHAPQQTVHHPSRVGEVGPKYYSHSDGSGAYDSKKTVPPSTFIANLGGNGSTPHQNSSVNQGGRESNYANQTPLESQVEKRPRKDSIRSAQYNTLYTYPEPQTEAPAGRYYRHRPVPYFYDCNTKKPSGVGSILKKSNAPRNRSSLAYNYQHLRASAPSRQPGETKFAGSSPHYRPHDDTRYWRPTSERHPQWDPWSHKDHPQSSADEQGPRDRPYSPQGSKSSPFESERSGDDYDKEQQYGPQYGPSAAPQRTITVQASHSEPPRYYKPDNASSYIINRAYDRPANNSAGKSPSRQRSHFERIPPPQRGPGRDYPFQPAGNRQTSAQYAPGGPASQARPGGYPEPYRGDPSQKTGYGVPPERYKYGNERVYKYPSNTGNLYQRRSRYSPHRRYTPRQQPCVRQQRGPAYRPHTNTICKIQRNRGKTYMDNVGPASRQEAPQQGFHGGQEANDSFIDPKVAAARRRRLFANYEPVESDSAEPERSKYKVNPALYKLQGARDSGRTMTRKKQMKPIPPPARPYRGAQYSGSENRWNQRQKHGEEGSYEQSLRPPTKYRSEYQNYGSQNRQVEQRNRSKYNSSERMTGSRTIGREGPERTSLSPAVQQPRSRSAQETANNRNGRESRPRSFDSRSASSGH